MAKNSKYVVEMIIRSLLDHYNMYIQLLIINNLLLCLGLISSICESNYCCTGIAASLWR